MRSLEIRVPGRPPGANDLVRMGHWKVSSVRERWRKTTVDAAVEAMAASPVSLPWEPLARATLGVTWRCKTKRRRDYDNLVSGIKPLLDGLVLAGVLEDDSTEVLVGIGPLRVEVGSPVDETVMTVQEV